MKLTLLVIRTSTPQQLKAQYEQLGFEFHYHRHGKGPFHYAAESNGFVFEIYPLDKSDEKADPGLRLGFEVEKLEKVIAGLRESKWRILSEIREREWGRLAIVQDLDGRKVELKQQH